MSVRSLTFGLVIVNVVLLALGAVVGRPPAAPAATGIRIGLVFDVGGKNDKSFNAAAFKGSQEPDKPPKPLVSVFTD